MSISDIVELEDHNQHFIILHSEGIFWRAYEKSAYAFATQIAPMQILKKGFKVLDGREICYLGFPMATAEKYLATLSLEEESGKMRKYRVPEIWDEAAYGKWHQEIPLHKEPLPQTGAAVRKAEPGEELPSACQREALEILRGFDILTHTPLDAFNLIISIQQMLKV